MKSRAHAKAGKRKSIDANLLGPCGFFCGFCLAHEKGVCLGCRYQADENARKGDPNFCTLLNCAEKHGVSRCLDCEEFPCGEFDPKVGMFSQVYMKYIRDEVKPA
jgi:predicted amidophosphoribosyltransferase